MFGVLNLNKPAGVTSRDVVNIVQRIVRPVKVGHAGTLDPMATGVLLVCLGGATRLISRLQKSQKTYRAEFTLGQRSDTDDSTGCVQNVSVTTIPDEAAITAALVAFVGCIDQIPPAFSAVKVSGQRAYTKARRGEDVVLKAKQVIVDSIDVICFAWPKLEVEIKCGSGTYIRSIARDLGESLDCGGLMSSLQRTVIGDFRVEDAVDAETLSAENVSDNLHNPMKIVAGLPQYRCSAEDAEQLKTGSRIMIDSDRITNDETSQQELTALTSEEGTQLLALAEQVDDGRQLQPRTVFVQ